MTTQFLKRSAFRDWRRGLILGIWLVVVLRIGSEFSGRGRAYWHHDLGLLYREQLSFYGGVYPAEEVLRSAPKTREAARSDYPPYSFCLAIPWLPPGLGWTASRVWFTLVQGMATAVVVAFAWRRGREIDQDLAWLLSGGVLAMTGLRADILFGNYGVVMAAWLVVLEWAVTRNRWRVAGVAWVVSVLKPQMGWLFALLFVRRQGWRTLVAAGASIVVLACLACAWTGVTPWEVFQSRYSNRVSTMALQPERLNLISLVGQWGIPSNVALPIGALAGMMAVAWVLRSWDGAANITWQFAFIGIVNRICTYHNACDDLLLVFALVVLGRHAWISGARMAWALFLLLGATVWMPTVMLQSNAARTGVVVAWIAVAAWLAATGTRAQLGEVGSESDQRTVAT